MRNQELRDTTPPIVCPNNPQELTKSEKWSPSDQNKSCGVHSTETPQNTWGWNCLPRTRSPPPTLSLRTPSVLPQTCSNFTGVLVCIMWMCRNNLRQFCAGHGTPRAPTPSQRAQAVEFSLKICFWTDKGNQWDLYPSESALGPFSRYYRS